MDSNELPRTKAGRVDWVIRADTNAEMQRRYDLWAANYDDDVGSFEDYLVPIGPAKHSTGIIGKSIWLFGNTHNVGIQFSI